MGVWVRVSYALAGAAFLSLIEWVNDLYCGTIERVSYARMLSREAHMAEQVARMNGEQLEVLKMWMQDDMNEAIAGETGSQFGESVVPDSFLRELVAESRGHELVPQRAYPEGSRKRQYYQAVVSYLIGQGLAQPPRGNKAATITQPWPIILEAIRNPK